MCLARMLLKAYMRTVGLPLRADRRISYLLEAFCLFCLPKPTQKVALVILFLKRRVHDPILHLDRVFPVASTFCPQRKALFALPQILSPASCFTICCCDDGFSEEHVHFALSGEQAKSKALPLPLDSRSHLSGPIYLGKSCALLRQCRLPLRNFFWSIS